MASSGIINGSCTGEYGKRYNFWIEWTVNSQNIAENTSNITAVCKVKRNVSWVYGYNLGKYPSVTLKIGGNKVTLTARDHIDTRDGKTSSFATWTGDVSHNEDGTLMLSVECSWTLTGVSSLTGGSAHGSAAIETIPRSIVPILSRSVSALGETIDINLMRENPLQTGELTWYFGGESGDIELTSETTAEWTPPLSFSAQMTGNPARATATVRCKTYEGETLVGTVNTNVTLFVPDNEDTKPHLEAELSPVNDLPGDAADYYVAGLTRIRADFSGTYGNYGASVLTSSITVNGVTVTGTGICELTTGILTSQEESIEAICSVTDSRGFTSSQSITLTLIPYSPPRIAPNGSSVLAARSDSHGNISRIGTYLKIIAATRFSPCTADGRDLNSCTLSVSYKRSDELEWSEWIAFRDVTVSEVAQGVTLTGSDAYDVRIRALDFFGRQFVYSTSVPASTVTLHLKHGGKGAAFGKFAEEDGLLDVAWRLRSVGGCTDIFDAGQITGGVIELLHSTVKDLYESHLAGNSVYVRYGNHACTVTYANKTTDETGTVYSVDAIGLEGSNVIRLTASGVAGGTARLSRKYATLTFRNG